MTSLFEFGMLCTHRRYSKSGEEADSRCPHCGHERDSSNLGAQETQESADQHLPDSLGPLNKTSVPNGHAGRRDADVLDGMKVSVCLDGFDAMERNGEEDDMPNLEETPPMPRSSVVRRVTRQSILDRVAVAKASNKVEAEEPQKMPNPDFTGEWVMVRYEGDMNEFMKEMGVTWAFRKAAGAVGYGVNKTFHSIVGNDERLHMTTKNPKGTFVKDLRVDGTEQDDVDPVHNKPIKIIPYWEALGNRVNLTIEAYMPEGKGDPIQLPITRRYKEGISMVVEQTSPLGVVIRRIFAPQ